MKTKIEHLSKGEFQIPNPEVVFPETRIIMRVGEGEIYTGSFSLQNQGEGTVLGLAYSSSFRMRCEDSGFDGSFVNIRYKYDGTGLIPGHVEHGKFTIVCNGGEFDIAFTAIIEKPFVMTSGGKVDGLDSFKKLAFRDPKEAEKLFRSRDFYTILKYEEPRILALYENLRKWELDMQAVEEFLVGCKQKEKIYLTLGEEGRAFIEPEGKRREIFTVKKNTWGYLPISIGVRGDFLSVAQAHTTTMEFAGNSYRVEYELDHTKLHPGSNFGEVLVESPYETLRYGIVVEYDVKRNEEYRYVDKEYAAILRSYLEYEGGRISLEDFAEESVKKLDRLREAGSINEAYLLFQANILLLAKRFEEARFLLESSDYSRVSAGQNVELSSYYLYLTSYLTNDSLGQRRVADELSRSFLRNPDSWKIMCMLLHVDSEYKILSERLRILERMFYQNQANHILFYLEAFKCFREKSSSLKKLGSFEVRVLLFAVKYGLMTKELALYTANLASQSKKFDKHLFQTLVKSYEMYPETMILTSICTLLIKGSCVHPDYFMWYEMAVLAELKIAQLYEYYMETLAVDSFKKALPRTVYLYFMHGNTLNYQKCAFLYANLITYEEENSEIYAHYRDEMEAFAWNQLERRNIDSQLRIVYKRFIVEDSMTSERIKALYDICHAYEITTRMKNLNYIYVIAEDGSIAGKAPYTEQGAKVFLYAKTDRLVWEHMNGRHYIDTVPYESRRLFYELRYMDMCRKYFNRLRSNKDKDAVPELTLERVREEGPEQYKDDELFTLCSKTIRETNYESDDLLTYLCHDLFEKGQYDKVTLTYLANYYSGSTVSMKQLWREGREYEVHTHKLGERILSQMLFTEQLYTEEAIFEEYYDGGAHLKLQQAYFAYKSREFVVEERKIKKSIIDIICREHENGAEIIDICKIAVLKYYAKREYNARIRKTLKIFLQELVHKQIYFSFFMDFEKEWLIELQLLDKTLIEYQGQKGSRVMLYYQLQREDSEAVEYSTEVLTPMYDTIFVKKFVLFANERLKYYFKETIDGNVYRSEKRIATCHRLEQEIGRYGGLNRILLNTGKERMYAIQRYAAEDAMALQLFDQVN